MSRFTRRTVLKLGAAAGALPWIGLHFAYAAARRHGLSLFGDLKYGPDFKNFDYLNPDAPKGGRIVMQAPNWNWNQNPQTFNTLNCFVDKGDAPPRMELTFDSLMTSAIDEPDSLYGLVAEAVEVADDENEVHFFLRDGPHFRDGTPVTAEDVAFSLTFFKDKGHISLRSTLLEMTKAEAAGEREVVVRFSGKQSRGLKLAVAALPIFSKAFQAANDIEVATLTPPLGSGAYKVGAFSAGRFIEYERDKDYWGADLPVNRGFNNFDVIRVEFYRDRTTGFEAFKKGDLTFREEFTSKMWATEYNFPALADGRVVKAEFPGEKMPDVQAFYFNTRRPQFADAATRRALSLAFNFEWINANLFYGSYDRSSSYFQGSDYAAKGLPSANELALLEPFRKDLPEEAFGEPFVPPRSDGTNRDRKLLGQAAALLKQAGWQIEGGQLRRDGVALTMECLVDDPQWERVLGVYVQSLRSIGVAATIRQVDPVQYQDRQNNFDFDLVAMRLTLGATPLESLVDLLTSDAAGHPGAKNLAGIKNGAVDALVQKALSAPDPKTYRTALSAIDRILRAENYAIPAWNKDTHWVAMWDVFGRPDSKPDYAFPVETMWWFDQAKAEKIGKG